MKTIWKYNLGPKTILEMPEGAEILDLQLQGENVCIWALVDPAKPKVKRTFVAVPTGSDCQFDSSAYVGSFQKKLKQEDNVLGLTVLVFHIFEQK